MNIYAKIETIVSERLSYNNKEKINQRIAQRIVIKALRRRLRNQD